MSAFSNYLENEILDWVNGGAFPTQPSATWVQLFNGSPTEAGGGGTALYSVCQGTLSRVQGRNKCQLSDRNR